MCYVDENGKDVMEKVPVEIGDYGKIYDNIIDVIEKGAEKIIRDDEAIAVLKIVSEGQEAARKAK